ncbi:hypothetical protein psal_cds_121 [Pandoravirus salinus]|uniref:Uncharacterized protein n=1 Tax=Pandoravirus salinus TaxID=1349410 RepID=S4VVX6_9VIRU|nr:hypothetical protein psal_cds_121 [Pandoravirus salinus]AGO83571.1 hypothetical protein psal_cds_121 [Pandoravirus salinus]
MASMAMEIMAIADQSYEMVDLAEPLDTVPPHDVDPRAASPLVEDHQVGSGLARSVPRRRSLIPPWVVGLAVIVVLPAAVALAIFLPWHVVGVQPHQDLVDRMRPVACVIVSTRILDTKPVAGGMMLLYLPGLAVRFTPVRDGHDKRNRSVGGNGPQSGSHNDSPGVVRESYQVDAVALPRLLRTQSWMGRDVIDDYFARHPINGTSTCYCDPHDPASRVVMRNGIDGLDTRAGYCVGASVLAYVVTLAVTIFVAGPHLCY